MTWLTVMEYMCTKFPWMCSVCPIYNPVLSHSSGLKQEEHDGSTRGAGTAILPEHLSSPPVFSGDGATSSLVLYVCFVNRSLSFFLWPLCCLSFDLRHLITLTGCLEIRMCLNVATCPTKECCLREINTKNSNEACLSRTKWTSLLSHRMQFVLTIIYLHNLLN